MNANDDLDPNLKLALAMAVIESKRRQKLHSSSATTTAATVSNGDGTQGVRTNASESEDAIKWKRKAKQRKEQILRLKEDLKLAEDGMHQDVYPQNVACKCYFFDNLGEIGPSHCIDGSGPDQNNFCDVLRRRFLRQVRICERKRRRSDGMLDRPCISDYASENILEELRDSVDFLVELCEKHSLLRVEGSNFKSWSHQAVDFILATFKALSSAGNVDETVESIVSSLILRLIRRMCVVSQGHESQPLHQDFKIYIQHLLRKLGSEPYIGQRVILSVSQRISAAAESLLYMDPFDGAFPQLHNFMYTMIQLIEFLVSDCLLSWSHTQDFDTNLLEEWVASLFHARKALELLESRNALYMLYMDRVVGDLTRQMGQVSFRQKLHPETLTKLFG